MTSPTLSTDVLLHIASYADPGTALACTQVNRAARAQRDSIVHEIYCRVFGDIRGTHRTDIMSHLIQIVEQKKDYTNNYRAPEDCMERWKWLVRVDNQLDRRFHRDYIDMFAILDVTRATTRGQAERLGKAYRHANEYFFKYQLFINQGQAKASRGLLGKIFFTSLVVFSRKCWGIPSLEAMRWRVPPKPVDYYVIGISKISHFCLI